MKFKQQLAILLLSLFFGSIVQAAGEPVNEDLTLLSELTQDMIELSKERDVEGFIKIVNPALRLLAENRNNSNVLPRVSAKLRAAKNAVKADKFTEAIEALEQAQKIMQKKKVLSWDGGSE